MDVDNNDILDQTLLQQFSCLGTTDKDELVKQLQTLTGGINFTTASFFLDMNNWNLQAAVCSYFDFESPFKLPSMALVRDETEITNNNTLPPNTIFQKSWCVKNIGDECWPSGCFLQFAGGTLLQCADRVPVPPLPPSTSTDLCLQMTSPAELGMFQSSWRMTTPSGAYFGDVIWLIVTVVDEETTNQLTDQLQHLHPLGTPQQREHSLTNPFNFNFQDSVPKIQDNDNTMC